MGSENKGGGREGGRERADLERERMSDRERERARADLVSNHHSNHA